MNGTGLKSFSAAEHMKGDSKYFCEACTSYQEAELRMRIKQLPKVLVVQLKRFKYIERLNALKKLSYVSVSRIPPACWFTRWTPCRSHGSNMGSRCQWLPGIITTS